jgi:hypothetical protein
MSDSQGSSDCPHLGMCKKIEPMTTFVKGLDLCQSFFQEIAQPILITTFPSLRYSAGLLGYGSDVLGFDDALSTDHNWGPRFTLFLPEESFEERKTHIMAAFAAGFPYEYKGLSVNFSAPDWHDKGVRRQEFISQGAVDPLIEYHTVREYFENYLGYTPFKDIPVAQWLTFTEHRLLGVTSGRVFHDDLGIREVRQELAYFPREIWLWLMAAQWTMIAEEEAFVGRCGYGEDDIGSRVIAARQVQRLMRLGFLLEKRYTPYSKWFGAAFKNLDIASVLLPTLEQVLRAANWQEREHYLGRAYQIVVEKHNALSLTEELSVEMSAYFGRPFQVVGAHRFAAALRRAIHCAELQHLVPAIGSVSQFTDSVTLFDDIKLYGKLQKLYQ